MRSAAASEICNCCSERAAEAGHACCDPPSASTGICMSAKGRENLYIPESTHVSMLRLCDDRSMCHARTTELSCMHAEWCPCSAATMSPCSAARNHVCGPGT